MDCSTPGFPVHHQLPELVQTHVHRVGDAIQPSHPLLSPSPPTFNLSQHQGLFQKSVLRIRWPKYWSFSFHVSSSNGYPGLISFRMDWLDLLAVQGILEEISILSNSVLSLYFFVLIAEEGFLISSCYSLELCIPMGVSFLFSFAFHFSSQLFVRPPQTTILLFCISFSWG